MKLTNKLSDKYLRFLNKYKGYVGFSGWLIMLNTELTDKGVVAFVETDTHEKEIRIDLSENFLDCCKEKQMNILFHELLHARINYFNLLSRDHITLLEEDLVNDLTRGYEAIGKLNWEKEKKKKNGNKRMYMHT